MFKRSVQYSVIGLVGMLGLSACANTEVTQSEANNSITVVASTNVYGNIAETIGGQWAEVTSILVDSSQDPHAFEASARTQLEVSRADIVIVNAGGYDDFMDALLKQKPKQQRSVIQIAGLSGKDLADPELNEHFWYHFPTMDRLAEDLAKQFSQRMPEQAHVFEQNLQTFRQELSNLEKQVEVIAASHAGTPIAVTEPVALYLLESMQLDNRMPEEFMHIVESGNDLPVRVLQEALGLFDRSEVKLLVYNEQTSSQQTQQIKQAADGNNIPIVAVQETLPSGYTYLLWMQRIIDQIRTSLETV